MNVNLKKLGEQVIVITGATSGIGLVTARLAAAHGARLVLTARNEPALEELAREIESKGSEAIFVPADVGREEEVQRVAEAAVQYYGGVDTWINNAAVSIYGSLLDVSTEDHRRLFDTNYWGVVYGSRAAVELLRERGGALINVGSVLSDRAVPQQGAYSASKHAVKGFTDALRMEIEERKLPISVTLVKPSAIDTPYREHAKNYLPNAPKNPPPVYAAETVAEAILHCAQHPKRDVVVGGGGRILSALGGLAPRLADRVMEGTMTRLHMTDEPAGDPDEHNLYAPGRDGEAHSPYPHYVMQRSLYTKAALHPVATALLTLGAGLLAAAVWKR